MALGNVIGVLLGGRLLDVNAERSHHGGCHVNVGLGDGLATNQAQGHGLLGVGSTHQQRGHILGRNLGSQIDVATSKATRGRDLEGQTALALHVLNASTVHGQSIDQITNWPLLHAVVSSQHALVDGARVSKRCHSS